MKVLVTGSNGFIGKNLVTRLKEISNIEVITYDKDDSFEKIINNINDTDFIFHLAGVNRPIDPKEFYEGNSDLTKQIVDLIKDKNIPLLITSSIQAIKDNDYGKSKKLAEKYIIENLDNYYIFRLHNVFGKWCRPNYNSVVATFCYNITHNLNIQIDNPDANLELVYIDDVVHEFINILNGQEPTNSENNICYITPCYKTNVGDLAKILYKFQKNLSTIYIPNTGDDFTKKLYSTFVSYLPLEDICIEAQTNVDKRGSFTELVRTDVCGQFSISTSKPGIVRGNHYHHTKLERFIVIKGKAKIRFTNILDDSYYELVVDDKNIKIVTIPVGYTHNIENIGNEDMILFIWCNELFDQEKPDTYFKEIEKGKNNA